MMREKVESTWFYRVRVHVCQSKTTLNQTPILGWYAVRCRSMKGNDFGHNIKLLIILHLSRECFISYKSRWREKIIQLTHIYHLTCSHISSNVVLHGIFLFIILLWVTITGGLNIGLVKANDYTCHGEVEYLRLYFYIYHMECKFCIVGI